MRRFSTVLILFVAAITSQMTAQARPATPEAYQVYSASLPFGYHTQGMTVAIRSRTVPVPDLSYAADSVQREFAAMRDDPGLRTAMQQLISQRKNADLAQHFHLAVSYQLLDSDALDGQLRLHDSPLAKKAGWRAFNEAHQTVDGLTEVSSIGFNPSHTVAIFYAIHRSGTGCNDEGFEVVEKSKGRWHRAPDKGFSFAACN